MKNEKMTEEIHAGGKVFSKNEPVNYETLKGEAREFMVVGPSQDNPPGLILKNTTNNRQFAVNAASVATRVTKIETPSDAPPQGEPPEDSSPPKKRFKWPKVPKFKIPNIKIPKFGGGSSSGAAPSNPTDPGKFFSEMLMLVALAIHLIDVFYLGASIDRGPIQIRVFLYFALVLTTIGITEGFSVSAIRRHIGVAAIPVFAIPLLGNLANLLGASPDVTDKIAGFTLLLPIYAFYLLKRPYLNYELLGNTRTKRFFSAFILPSGWLRIFIVILTIAIISEVLVASASMAGEGAGAAGFEGTGFSPREVLAGARDILISPFQRVIEFIKSIGPGVSNIYEDLYNQTLGEYYRGEVEQNKERTGAFINDFKPIGTLFEGVPVELVATIQIRSFVERVNISTACHAISSRNDNVIEGNTSPELIENVFRNNYLSVSCRFDHLPEGRYDVIFTADFNFETWAYTTLTFMDRDFLSDLYSDFVDVNREFDINARTRTIFTSGPVMLGMNDGRDLPIALSTSNDGTENLVTLGITIDDRYQAGASGRIRNVNAFQIRAPEEFQLIEEYCAIPGRGGIVTEEDELEGYNVHTFDITHTPGIYTTVSCNSRISPSGARSILNDPSGKRDVTIVGTAIYDYEMSSRSSIHVRGLG